VIEHGGAFWDLSDLSDQNYSPQTVRVYGFSSLAFCRWLTSEEIDLDAVNTDVLLRYLAACRQATVRLLLRAGSETRPRGTTLCAELANSEQYCRS
jgi:hypothetical protein